MIVTDEARLVARRVAAKLEGKHLISDACRRLPGTWVRVHRAVYPGGRMAYSHWDAVDEQNATHFVPDDVLHSEYNGSPINIANYQWMLANHRDEVVDVYGGHGTAGVLIPVTLSDEALLDALLRLHDYPVFDDDQLSETEQKLADAAWELWGRDDYRRALEKLHPRRKFSKAQLDRAFTAVLSRGTYAWEADGPDMHINVEDVAIATSKDDLSKRRITVCD